MPDLTIQQRFGSTVSYDEATQVLSIDLNNLTDESNGGDIKNNLGLNDVSSITQANINQYASKILYGLLLLSSQNQALDINEDAEQKIYITNGGLRINSNGSRSGQVQRVLSVNLFDTSNTLNNLVDIDDV